VFALTILPLIHQAPRDHPVLGATRPS
jgi:hypothetical protein